MSALRLRDFSRVVPSCGYTERLSAAVELMLRDQSDCLVLLDEQTSPGIWEAVGPAGCEIKTFKHQDLSDLESSLGFNRSTLLI